MGILKISREEKSIIDTDILLRLLKDANGRVRMSFGPYTSDATCREDTGLNAEDLSRAAMNPPYHTTRTIAC